MTGWRERREWGVRAALLVAALPAIATTACSSAKVPPSASGTLHAGLRVGNDPTVRGARLVPEALDLAGATPEPSGSVRGLVQGARFRVDARHAIHTSEDRLDDGAFVLPVPARMGGGFLFAAGDTLYRADDWLARPRPWFRSSRGISSAFVGLDRIYVKTKNGSHVGFDATTGAALDLGPWPADPFVGTYVALDGWRAVALTDIQGALGTSDAGRSWSPLRIPIRAQTITPVRRDAETGGWAEVGSDTPGEAFVVSDGASFPAPRLPRGASEPPPVHCYLVSGALLVSSLESCADVTPLAAERRPARFEATLLRAALLDGWPLDDRTALVASEGTLTRVSLDDGTAVETATSAFDPHLGHCHAVRLGTAEAKAIGFVCGAQHGATAILTYDTAAGRLRVARRFSGPRLVHECGNGGLLVLGSCVDVAAHPSTYCIGTPLPGNARGDYLWRDVSLPDAPGAVATVTSDGRLARVEAEGNLEDARVTFVNARGEAKSVRLRLLDARPATRRLAARAVWLNDLEERTPGVLSGWIASEGTLVGLEIDAEGSVRIGALVQDLGSPFVAGPYGLAWTRSRQGFETTDGGMTWTHFQAPPGLAMSSVRACGPAGCVLDGWLRVGWGERPEETFAPVRPMPPFRGDPAAPFRLECRPLEPLPRRPAAHAPPFAVDLLSMLGGPSVVLPGSFTLGTPALNETSFRAPSITTADHLLHADVFQAFDSPHLGPIGRVYAWGPASGDWSAIGRWATLWRSPFDGKSTVRSTVEALAPFPDAESARAELGLGRGGPAGFAGTVSEDGTHALIVVTRNGRTPELLTVDEGGASAPIRRADGASWGRVDAALRIGREWLIAAPTDTRGNVVEILRAADGVAHRIATVPRLLATPPGNTVRLARGDEEGALGVIVEGEPSPERAGARRWVIPVDVDSGLVHAPESLGAVDLSDRSEVAVCDARGTSGWTLDATWPNPNVTVELADEGGPALVSRVFARLRLSSDRACVERLAGEVDGDALRRANGRPPRGLATGGPSLFVTLAFGGSDESSVLQCSRPREAAPSAR